MTGTVLRFWQGSLPALVLLALAAGSAQAACDEPPQRRVNWINCQKAGAELARADLRNSVLNGTDLSGPGPRTGREPSGSL